MHLAVKTDGAWQIVYTWLPAWIGMNKALMIELARHLSAKFADVDLPEEEMQSLVDEEIASWIQDRCPGILGLRSHLLSLLEIEQS